MRSSCSFTLISLWFLCVYHCILLSWFHHPATSSYLPKYFLECFPLVSNMTSTQLVYAYPVFLSFEDANQNEVFITFQEPNFFNNPWSSLGLKISASIIWLIGLCGSGFICTFVFYETQGYAASFRTVINQLVTWCYFYVSLKNVSDCIPY